MRILEGRGGGPPVHTYEPIPGVPPVRVFRFDGREMPLGDPSARYAHSHDFLGLVYFERGGGALRLDDREWPVEDGDAYVISPGEVIGAGVGASAFHEAQGWSVAFPPGVLGSQAPGAFLSWRSHPLLFPFVGGAAGGAQRLKVPLTERALWTERFSALGDELRERRDGYHEAVLSHLTLILVELSRLASDVVGDLKLKDEPLLAEVFGFIEEHYGKRISLKEVARAVSLTPGHLTTVVRRKTGRTVLEWISERRMTEARKLLVQTNLAIEEVGSKVGYGDSAYFIRHFKRTHGTTPLAWRHAGRP